MANELKNGAEPGAGTLVADIVKDAEELVRQQLAMFRAELKEDMRKTRQALIPLACGFGLALMGGVLLFHALALFVNWACPALNIAASYGLVGGVVVAAGMALAWVGKKQFESFNPLPDKTAEAVQENVRWMNNPK